LYKRLASAAAALALGLGVLATTPVVAEDLPTPEMIVNKYVKATGGADKWKAVKSRTTKGNLMVVAMGMSGTMTSYVEPPNAKSVMALEGFGEFLSGVKDGKAWSSNMMQGDVLLEGAEAKGALRQLDLAEWVNWQAHYPTAETVGEEAVGETACWKVTFTPEEGDTINVWFDKESGLIVQTYGPGMGGPATTTFSDYKDVAGLKIAHKQSIEGMNGAVEIALESVEVNSKIDPAMFDVPAGIAALMNPPEVVKPPAILDDSVD
jgi:hypothetical protein